MLELYGFPFSAMGTECNLYFYVEDESRAQETAGEAIGEVRRIEAKYSRYLSDGVLYQINRAARSGGAIGVDEETGALIDFAFACHEKSGGLFDITTGVLRGAWGNFDEPSLPDKKIVDPLLQKVGMNKISWSGGRLKFSVPGMELDLGGLGKEYAADRAAEICASKGITRGLADLGGDVKVLGPHPDGDPWEIGIRHPRRSGAILGNVEIQRGALASSGDYERCIIVDGVRYGHILSPATGWPEPGLASVSVVAESCLVAGSLTTIAMLKGKGGVEWLKTLREPFLWVDEAGTNGGTLVLKDQ